MTGGRIKRLTKYIKNEVYAHLWRWSFRFKYKKLVKFHIKNRATGTLTAVRPLQDLELSN